MSITTTGWDVVTELELGIQAEGEALEDDGSNMAGEIAIYHEGDGSIVYAEDISGAFFVLLAPPIGVEQGADNSPIITEGNLALQFTPEFMGLAYDEPDVSLFHSISYSGVEGNVTDAEGFEVENTSIVGNNDAATTDLNGYYSILAPEGVSSDILGLKRTKTKSFTAPTGDKAVVDWQFAGITVRVQTPNDYEPIPGAPVEIDGEQYETDESGEVVFARAGLDTSHLVRVFENDAYEDTVLAPAKEGGMSVVRVGPENSDFGSGGSSPYSVHLTVFDKATGKKVRNVSVYEVNNDVTASTRADGETSLVLPDLPDGEADIVVAEDNQRYRAESIVVDAVQGNTVAASVRLTPKRQSTNV